MNISHPLRQKEKQKDRLIRGKPLLALSTWLVITDTIFMVREKKKSRTGPVLCVPVSI